MSEQALEREDLERLPIFPLPSAALFPGARLPLHVFEPRYRDLVRDAIQGTGGLGVPHLKPGFEADYLGRPPVFELCGARWSPTLGRTEPARGPHLTRKRFQHIMSPAAPMPTLAVRHLHAPT